MPNPGDPSSITSSFTSQGYYPLPEEQQDAQFVESLQQQQYSHLVPQAEYPVWSTNPFPVSLPAYPQPKIAHPLPFAYQQQYQQPPTTSLPQGYTIPLQSNYPASDYRSAQLVGTAQAPQSSSRTAPLTEFQAPHGNTASDTTPLEPWEEPKGCLWTLDDGSLCQEKMRPADMSQHILDKHNPLIFLGFTVKNGSRSTVHGVDSSTSTAQCANAKQYLNCHWDECRYDEPLQLKSFQNHLLTHVDVKTLCRKCGRGLSSSAEVIAHGKICTEKVKRPRKRRGENSEREGDNGKRRKNGL